MAIQTNLRMTVTEFDEWVERPENYDKLFEFIGGEIVEVPSSPYGSMIAARFIGELFGFVDALKLGYVTGEGGGYTVAGERYIPSAAFISKQRQPELPDLGYVPNPPDLAVEVDMLPHIDEAQELRFKLVNYLHVGTTVWVVCVQKKQVEVYQPKLSTKLYGIEDTLDGGDVLPGFTLPLKTIFPE